MPVRDQQKMSNSFMVIRLRKKLNYLQRKRCMGKSIELEKKSYEQTFNQFYPFNTISIESLIFSNKPDPWLNFSFKITAVANFQVQLNHIKISQFINLIPSHTFYDRFRKKFKAGQKIVYQSPYLKNGIIGHETLRTFN